MKISVVVPVYNEAESLPILTEELNVALARYERELIYVNDGSTDKSGEVLSELAKKDPRIRVLTFRRNFGQTAALAAGFDKATGDIIVTLDADLQNDPSSIPKMIEKLEEGYDLVSGIRADRKDAYWTRRIPSMLANGLISRITGVPIRDSGCSLKAYRREVLKDVQLYGEMHRFLPALMAWAGGRVTEMEVLHRARRFGQSNYPSLGRTWKVILDLFVIKFLFSYQTKPIYLFGAVAFAFIFTSFGLSVFVAIRKIFFHGEWFSPLFILAVSFFSLSVLFLLLGLIADLLIRTYHESQGKSIYALKND